MLVKEILDENFNDFYECVICYNDVKYYNLNMIYTNLGLFFIETEDIPCDKYEQIKMAKIYKQYAKHKNLKLFCNLEYLELHIDETNYNLFCAIGELTNLNILYLSICDIYNEIFCDILCNLPNVKSLLIELITYCAIDEYLANLPTSLENIIFITSDVDDQKDYIKKIIKIIKLPLGCKVYHLHRFATLTNNGLSSIEADITNLNTCR